MSDYTKTDVVLSKIIPLSLRRRPGFELKPPHEVCCNCGKGPEQPCAYNDGGTWVLHWYCDVCGGSRLDGEHEIEWPLRINYATADDLRELGFFIV